MIGQNTPPELNHGPGRDDVNKLLQKCTVFMQNTGTPNGYREACAEAGVGRGNSSLRWEPQTSVERMHTRI